MSRLWLIAAVMGLAVAFGLAGAASAQDAAPGEAPTLEGKVVVVYLKSDPKAGAVLQSVQVQTLGDRAFLVGSGADLGDPSRAGLVQWIPVDDIGRIHEFQNLEELRSRTRVGQ